MRILSTCYTGVIFDQKGLLAFLVRFFWSDYVCLIHVSKCITKLTYYFTFFFFFKKRKKFNLKKVFFKKSFSEKKFFYSILFSFKHIFEISKWSKWTTWLCRYKSDRYFLCHHGLSVHTSATTLGAIENYLFILVIVFFTFF
jgi:hypothetical protein